MKVVIVAKTRQGSGACIGAISFEGQSLRLVAADAAQDDHSGLEYNVGDVWDIDCRPVERVIPPHVENVVVHDKRPLPLLDDPAAFIRRHVPPKEGSVEVLYEGLTGYTKAGVLYVAERIGIPPYSTTFWVPDRPLERMDDGKRIRYRYPLTEPGAVQNPVQAHESFAGDRQPPANYRTITFVGFQDPPAIIPAGTLLRVSLAHWWRPVEKPEGELRCYLQLSGWFDETMKPDWAPTGVAEDDYVNTVQVIASPEMEDEEPDLDMTRAMGLLAGVFGYDEFWPHQAEVIENLLARRDTLAIMPTGSGKSLCFQIPALMFAGLTVVVSPLISLMQDQVEQLRQLGVAAAFLNSTLSYREYLNTSNQVREGRIKLLYVAPETLLRPETLVLIEKANLECLVVDEAHCISSWGHDFRPEYRQIIDVRRRLPQATCFALTATATQRVRDDIKQSLGFREADTFIASFDRKNLFLEVQPKINAIQQILSFLDGRQEQSGIIYCATRKRVDALAGELSAMGLSVLPYHAGLDDGTRRQNQGAFSHDKALIMVATIAFGMGINKSNVRYIVHHDLPKNIENYYQQIGRAGRDGLRADCLLLYSAGDIATIGHFITEMEPERQRGAWQRLEALKAYALTTECRRRPLLSYFGETYSKVACEMCDNCRAGNQGSDDVTIPAQMFLSCVKRTGELFGVNHIVRVLRGSQAKEVLSKGHDKLSTYGIGRDYSADQWRHLAHQFVSQGLLEVDDKYGGLRLAEAAYEVFRGKTVMGVLTLPSEMDSFADPESDAYDAGLMAKLKAKRLELARGSGVPPYVIFPDSTLAEMATYFPQSTDSFAGMTGVGQVKLDKYAAEFLPVIRAYCKEHGLKEKPKANRRSGISSRRTRQPGISPRSLEVAEAYNDGRSVTDIAAEMGIKESTVINHLWKYVQAGYSLRSQDLLEMSTLSAEVQEQVLSAFDELGSDRLRPIYNALDGEVPYDELSILRLYHANQD